jgi:N-terminal domain of anti-restriction factor ArdC
MPNYHGPNSRATDSHSRWSELLQQAVSEPGLILKAYSSFHGYSIGNQIAALVQCHARKIQPGPINTYPGWQRLNRQVMKGQKAIWLCMPITYRRKAEQDSNGQGEDNQAANPEVITGFVWKPNWFVLAQTNGQPVSMPEITEWDKSKALAALNITEAEFSHTNGNVQGYAVKRQVAISPLAELPHKTLFHELADIELGHTSEAEVSDSETTPRSLREVEAEGVALILCESLSLTGAGYCRGYIQNWLSSDVIPEKSAQKIFGAADRILRAGQSRAE